MFRRMQVFDIIVLLNTAFVALGAAIAWRVADEPFFWGFVAGGALGWLNNLAFRTGLRVIAAQSWLWRIGVVFFVFLFGFKLLFNFWAIYYLIVVWDLGGLAVLSGLVPGIAAVILGSLIYSRRLQAE